MSKLKNADQTSRRLIFGSDNPNAVEVKDLRKIYSSKEFMEEVGLYNEKFEYREGHELSKRFRNKYSIGSLPVPLYYVRKHNGNRSNDVENIKKYDAQLGN